MERRALLRKRAFFPAAKVSLAFDIWKMRRRNYFNNYLENYSNSERNKIKKQSTHVEGKRIEIEELKIDSFITKLDKFGVAFKMNNKRHIGIYFNDKSQIVLDTLLMIFKYSEKVFVIPEKKQRKTLLLSKGR
jgi:predicted N-acyltransferase